jgi:signal transduction histidine kinase
MIRPALEEEDTLHYHDIASSSCNILNLKLSDFLDFNSIESDKFDMRKDFFSIEKLIKEVSMIVFPHCKSKDFDLSFTISEGLPDKIKQDC